MIVATLVVLAAGAVTALAFDVFRVPNPSVYLLFAAGVGALVMLRRRTS
jgi:hypothetical protein